MVVSWSLIEAGGDMRFEVFRRADTDRDYQLLSSARPVRNGLSFEIEDNAVAAGTSYQYRIDVMDEDGRKTLFETQAIYVGGFALGLEQNVPNPFNPTTTISFVLPERAAVTLSVFNVHGQLVRTLVNELLSNGRHEAVWNGRDNKENPVSSGIYCYRLIAGKKTLTKKMLLIK